MHVFNQMDAPEIDAYIDNLTQRLVNRYNIIVIFVFMQYLLGTKVRKIQSV